MKKRILSIVLSIVMLVSLLPTTALALETPSHTDHCVCGGSVTAGDHTHDAAASTWKAWNGEDASAFTGGIQLNAGNYYLTGNLTLSETIRISGTVNLCLNGHSITTSETNAINVSSGTTLNICDCSEEGLGSISTTGDGSEGDVIYNYYGTVNVYGGSISATGSRGDGIYNIGNGTKGVVNIYGGNISTDTSNLYYGIRNKGGIVNVYDGSISALGDSPYGIYSTHSATVSDGTVSGSTSGIHNANADAILIVSGSASVIGDSYGISSYCGNLQLSGNPGITGGSADIRLDGGTNNAPTIGIDGVLANTEKYTVMTYQTPTTENPVVFTSAVDEGNADKFESADSAYQVIYEGGVLKLAVSSATPAHAHDMSVSCGGSGVTFEAWDGTGTPTGNVYLTGDVTLAETLIISSGTVNLCLNGYSITRSDWYPTIRIEDGATLNLCDCNGSGKNNGSVTNNFDVCVVNDGALTVYGGTVEGPTWGITNRGTLTVYGGSVASTGERGIYNAEGTVYVYGGTVSGNSYGIYNEGGTANVTGGTVTATGSNFYGIYNRSNGTVTVSGGTVTATGSNSWGIYNHSDGTTDVDTTTNVSGTANVSGSFLGIYNSGTLTVSGGTVTATGSNGFGIYNFYHGAGSLELSGAPTITGATAGVYLDGGSITLGGELTYVEEKAISVGMETPGTFTSGWNSNMSGKTPGNYFTSAMDGYTVQPDGSGELKLAEPPAHSHDMSVECGGSGVTFEPWDGTTTFPGGNVYLTKDVTLADTLTISSGTVNMCLNGHSITNSSAAIEVKSGATLNICDCQTTAGTISATASGSRGIENYGILTVYGGTVSGNTYGICNNYGGNVAVSGGTVSGGTGISNYGTLTVSGGSVTGTYDYGGYGISSYGTLKLSGAPTITGGSNSADVLIHAYQKVITIDGTLTYSTPISVEPYNGYSAFTEGWNDKMPTADHNDYFIPASGKYVFVESSDELKPAYTVTYDANVAASGSVPVDSSSPYFYSNVVTVLDNTGGLAKEGYEFSGWNTKADGTGTHYAPDSTFTIYSNTTLYAVWKVPHIHEYTYAVNTENAAQIIESCTCGHEETATVSGPTGTIVYDGTEKKGATVSYSTGWLGGTLTVTYQNNINAGQATASITKAGATASVKFTINKAEPGYNPPTAKQDLVYSGIEKELVNKGTATGGSMQYALGADGTTAPASGWSTYVPVGRDAGTYYVWYKVVGDDNHNDVAPACVAVTIEQQALTIVWGNSNFTYDGAEKFPAFHVDGIWNADDVQVIIEGAQTNAGEYTAQIIGLTGSDAGNYKLTGTLTKDFFINKADQAAPAVNKANETISGKNDGKITDVTANMEYRAEGEDRYTAITGEAVDNLADGKYYVRVKGDSNHNPSADTVVMIGAGRMLTVTVPQNQVGYTMTVDKSTATYGEAVKVTFALNDGYSAADGFAVKLNGGAITLSNGEYTVANTTEDLAFTVEGVADITAPLAQIDIKNNKWTSFWNGVTFGLFFNETQDVTITATDTGSGVNSIQYYLASGELELEEVKQITDWQDYNGTFQIDPDNAYVVYVKVTDNAGNVSYLNSDGVVLDQTVPVLVGIENGEDYYGDKSIKALDDYLDTLKVDGVDVTDELNGDNEYTIVADNAKHIVTATDKAGNVTEYQIKVYKNYTVTYKVDGNTVSTQTVGHGKDATAPTFPEKVGYTQTAPVWDKDGTNITADTEINAVYTINKYTVTYKADGNVVGTVEVEHGKDATAPAIPEKEGYTKTAPVWDKDGKNITADTEINAVYTINEYTITFMYEDGVYKTLTVKHGEKVEMPEVPAKDGYTVTWDTTIEVATSDATVNAVYTKNAVSDIPQTGDNSNLTLWWILLLVAAAGITLATIEQKKRKAMK